jgi:DNA-binding NarL/FixJ family response regulator
MAVYAVVKAATPVPAQGRARILIVDDDRFMRHSVFRLISTEPGLTVIGEAANGQDAVTLARALRPDVVVMDVRMPLMDGIEATFLITEEMPDTLVVGFSSSCEQNIKAKMLKAGAVDFLDKCEDVSRLGTTLNRLWAGPAGRQARHFGPALAGATLPTTARKIPTNQPIEVMVADAPLE